MKKLFFCLFSTLFIALCVWLGLNTECYGYYEQATSNNIYYVKTTDNNLFTSCSNFQDICGVLETIGNFYYKNDDSILLCSYNELFSENYVYTIDTADYSTFIINFYFNIQNSSYNLSKYNFDTNGIDKYYNNNTNYTPCCRLSIALYNNNKTLYEMYFVRYDNGGFTYIYPKARPTNTNGRTQFNDMYSESYTNIAMNFNNSVLGTSTPSPVDPPSQEEEDNRNILELLQDFFANFGDNLVHIVVPSAEDMEELQESFEENILDKFAISSISRSSSYDNNSLYPLEYENHKPVFIIYGYEFQSSMITDFMNTPISFGKLQNYQSTTEHSTDIATGGLTPFAIINLMFGISITAFNIIMFNKFFEKE